MVFGFGHHSLQLQWMEPNVTGSNTCIQCAPDHNLFSLQNPMPKIRIVVLLATVELLFFYSYLWVELISQKVIRAFMHPMLQYISVKILSHDDILPKLRYYIHY
ncbi:hypothetical protein ACOSP7_025141 [Xanthoceras sorbifolium]